jgi:hypothetical protein
MIAGTSWDQAQARSPRKDDGPAPRMQGARTTIRQRASLPSPAGGSKGHLCGRQGNDAEPGARSDQAGRVWCPSEGTRGMPQSRPWLPENAAVCYHFIRSRVDLEHVE